MTNDRRSELLESIANTISDYRQGEIERPDPEHVERWVKQFDAPVQEPLLAELDHVLKKTYITRANVEQFLRGLLTVRRLAGDDPCDFWRRVNFLNIQDRGNSQREMLAMFEAVLQRDCGLDLNQCGSADGPYVYLDDGIFTGNRIKNDLSAWIQSCAPTTVKVEVVVIAIHRQGRWYANNRLERVSSVAGKTVHIDWWRIVEIEDRKQHIATSDVLRPSSVPADAAVQEYIEGLDYDVALRSGDDVGENGVFSCGIGRNLLEQELLKKGAYIRSICPYLGPYQRPLGNMVLQTLGFGALIVTFRNCANNCPLALWVDDPWYPLFPRKTN